MPYRSTSAGFSSLFTLTTSITPACSSEMSSRTGAIARHGPHHSAQKSTTTGTVCDRAITSVSNVLVDEERVGMRGFPSIGLKARRSLTVISARAAPGVSGAQLLGTPMTSL